MAEIRSAGSGENTIRMADVLGAFSLAGDLAIARREVANGKTPV